MKYLFILIIIILFTATIYSKEAVLPKKVVGIKYFKPIFGHVRVNPSEYAESLSAISCGHPVKLYETLKGGFQHAKVGPYVGFIKRTHLSSKRPKCFQDKYPKFYEALHLEITEMYYWGKLTDQYIMGKSKLK